MGWKFDEGWTNLRFSCCDLTTRFNTKTFRNTNELNARRDRVDTALLGFTWTFQRLGALAWLPFNATSPPSWFATLFHINLSVPLGLDVGIADAWFSLGLTEPADPELLMNCACWVVLPCQDLSDSPRAIGPWYDSFAHWRCIIFHLCLTFTPTQPILHPFISELCRFHLGNFLSGQPCLLRTTRAEHCYGLSLLQGIFPFKQPSCLGIDELVAGIIRRHNLPWTCHSGTDWSIQIDP